MKSEKPFTCLKYINSQPVPLYLVEMKSSAKASWNASVKKDDLRTSITDEGLNEWHSPWSVKTGSNSLHEHWL